MSGMELVDETEQSMTYTVKPDQVNQSVEEGQQNDIVELKNDLNVSDASVRSGDARGSITEGQARLNGIKKTIQ